jgi:hypothetical protein
MEVFMLLNGHEIEPSVDEQEQIIIGVESGKVRKSSEASGLVIILSMGYEDFLAGKLYEEIKN